MQAPLANTYDMATFSTALTVVPATTRLTHMKNTLTGAGPIFDEIDEQLNKAIQPLLQRGIDDREIVFKLSEAMVRLAEASKENDSAEWLLAAAHYLVDESAALEAARDPAVPLVDSIIKPGQA